MTKEERGEMYKQGYTLQQIADAEGVTRQAVHQSICRSYAFRPKTVARCVYPSIRTWLIEQRLTISGLNRRLGLRESTANHSKTMRFLEGKTFDKDLVDGIIKASGMTYEEAFEECPICKMAAEKYEER